MKGQKLTSLTDVEALKLAHDPRVIAAEILAEAIGKAATELSGAIRTATIGDELIGVKSPIIEAAKVVSADIRELLETLFIERGIG
jgi:hypothetical protein